MCSGLEQQRPRIEILIDPVTEALEAKTVLGVAGLGQGRIDGELAPVDGFEHLDDGDGRAAVDRAPKRADASGA